LVVAARDGSGMGGGGALGAEATPPPPSYIDPALGYHELRPSICFKGRLILVYSFARYYKMMSVTVLTAPEGR